MPSTVSSLSQQRGIGVARAGPTKPTKLFRLQVSGGVPKAMCAITHLALFNGAVLPLELSARLFLSQPIFTAGEFVPALKIR